VGQVGQQRLAAPLGRLQRLGHPVEGTAERGQLVIAVGHGHPCLVATGTDPRSHVGQGPDGPGEPLRQQPAGRQCGDQRGPDRQAEREQQRAFEPPLQVEGGLGGEGRECLAGVEAKQAWRDRQRHHGQGETAGHDHQQLGGEQAGGEATPAAAGAHCPGPMR
jgi:hypothetical protein